MVDSFLDYFKWLHKNIPAAVDPLARMLESVRHFMYGTDSNRKKKFIFNGLLDGNGNIVLLLNSFDIEVVL